MIAQGIMGSIIDHRLRALRSALEAQPGKKQPAVDVSAPTADLVLHAGSGVSVVVIAEILLLMSVKPAGSEILWSLFGMVALAGLAVWRASRLSRAPSPT